MKKIRLIVILAVCAIIAYFAAKNWGFRVDQVEQDVEVVKSIVDIIDDKLVDLGVDQDLLDKAIEKLDKCNEESEYVVAFEIESEADLIVSMTLFLPVEKEFFDSVNVGDRVAEEIISGFANLDESVGHWKITVADKVIRELPE